MAKKSSFLINIITLFVSNLGAQVVALLAIPIVTRIFLPAEYGKLAMLWSLASLVGGLACLKYEETIILEKDKYTSEILVSNCLWISILIAFISGLILYFMDESVLQAYFKIDNAPLVISLAILFVGISKPHVSLAVKIKYFRQYGLAMVIGAIFSACWKIAMGYQGYPYVETLLVGNVAGTLIPSMILLVVLRKRFKIHFFSLKLSCRYNAIKQYAYFSKKQVPNALLNGLQLQAPVLIFALYYSPATIGYYGLAQTIILMPVNAFNRAISKIYLQKLAAYEEGQDYYQGFISILRNLALLALIPCAVLAAYGSELFVLVLGNEWQGAGYVASLLVPWLYMVIIKAPVTQVLIVKKKLKYILVFS